jgi:hypothetical protein
VPKSVPCPYIKWAVPKAVTRVRNSVKPFTDLIVIPQELL